jgi:hypothetical protein
VDCTRGGAQASESRDLAIAMEVSQIRPHAGC